MNRANWSTEAARLLTFVIGAIVILAAPGYSAPSVHSLNAAAPSVVKNERVKIAVEGMHCESCASGIKAMLKRTPGVISAEVSFEQKEAVVEYDSSRTSAAKVVEAINNLGYKAKLKE